MKCKMPAVQRNMPEGHSATHPSEAVCESLTTTQLNHLQPWQ